MIAVAELAVGKNLTGQGILEGVVENIAGAGMVPVVDQSGGGGDVQVFGPDGIEDGNGWRGERKIRQHHAIELSTAGMRVPTSAELKAIQRNGERLGEQSNRAWARNNYLEVRLFGRTWVSPWNPYASGAWDTTKAYGGALYRTVGGVATGAVMGGVTGAVTGGAIGAYGGPQTAAAGFFAGGIGGMIWGGFSGLVSAATADSLGEMAHDATVGGALSGVTTGPWAGVSKLFGWLAASGAVVGRMMGGVAVPGGGQLLVIVVGPATWRALATGTAVAGHVAGAVTVVHMAAGQEPRAEVPRPNGQEHHVMSKKVAGAASEHPVLRGKIKYRDPNYVTRAIDKEAHRGYQTWHRELDNEVAAWLRDRKNQRATLEEFEAWLRERYSKPDLKARFPNGI